MNETLLEQKRRQYHAHITHPAIEKELHLLSHVFKELIFLFGVLDPTTETMVKHYITEGIPMLFRPMDVVQGKEKKRYHTLVLNTLEKMKRRLACQLLLKEERHAEILQPVIQTLLQDHKKG